MKILSGRKIPPLFFCVLELLDYSCLNPHISLNTEQKAEEEFVAYYGCVFAWLTYEPTLSRD